MVKVRLPHHRDLVRSCMSRVGLVWRLVLSEHSPDSRLCCWSSLNGVQRPRRVLVILASGVFRLAIQQLGHSSEITGSGVGNPGSPTVHLITPSGGVEVRCKSDAEVIKTGCDRGM